MQLSFKQTKNLLPITVNWNIYNAFTCVESAKEIITILETTVSQAVSQIISDQKYTPQTLTAFTDILNSLLNGTYLDGSGGKHKNLTIYLEKHKEQYLIVCTNLVLYLLKNNTSSLEVETADGFVLKQPIIDILNKLCTHSDPYIASAAWAIPISRSKTKSEKLESGSQNTKWGQEKPRAQWGRGQSQRGQWDRRQTPWGQEQPRAEWGDDNYDEGANEDW